LSAELVQLAQTAATTLVGAAATQTWNTTRTGFLRLFHRGGRHDLAERRLDDTSGEIERAADPAERDRVRAELVSAWQTRLGDLLEEHPEAVTELRDLLRTLGADETKNVHTTNVTAYDQATVSVSHGGTINATINHHER
jgi:hypothetical protein